MNILDQLLEHLQDNKTFKEVVDSANNSPQNVNIRIDNLPAGAGAQTLPTGEIIINKKILDDDQIDTAEASKVIHELSHALHDKNYLDRESERKAFQAQVQFMIESGLSPDDIRQKLLPTFEDYKTPSEAEALLNDMIEKSHRKLEASFTRRALAAKLTFTPEEKQVIDQIKDVAEKLEITVYLAGGLIRDRLLGKENSDLDFVTNKGSDILAKALAKKFRLSDPVKLDRSGATMVYMNGKHLDIIDAEKVFAPLRTKDQTLEKGQEGEMSIFLDDAFRRDLTINSLMYNIHTEELLDPTGQGLSDLQNKIIRTIVDPNIKYRIHAPDMLRALRFYATGGDYKFAPGMLEAMQANAARVTPREKGGDISARRIERELRKAFKDPTQWAKMKSAMAEVGLYDYIGKQIEDVDKDRKGDIEYFNKPTQSTTTAAQRKEPKHSAPLKSLIEEHERLIEILKSPSHQDDLQELEEQQKELAEYKQEYKAKKQAQVSDAFIQGPDVQIDPSLQNEIKDAVAELKRTDPSFFKGVSKIVALTGGPFGQVSSADPTIIHINLPKIKQEIQRQLGSQYNASNAEHKKVFNEAVKRSIVETIAHEAGHVRDFDPENGTFPGGEGSAESLESKIMNQLQYNKPVPFNPSAQVFNLTRKAILVQKINPHTGTKQWALVSKKDRSKVLEWYGATKPSDARVEKTERRVQYFKNKAGTLLLSHKYANEEVATIAVVDDQDTLLMGPRKDDGTWTLPGGHLEKSETPPEAAVRELAEETSIEIDEDDLQWLGSKTVSTPTGDPVRVHSFMLQSNESADPTADPDNELTEWQNISITDGLPDYVADNLHNGDNDVTLQFMGLQEKTATDYAGRPIPNDPVFMGTIVQHNIPMNPNYHGGEILKKKKEKEEQGQVDQSKETNKNER